MKYFVSIFFLIFAYSLSAQNISLNFSKIKYGEQQQFFNSRSLSLAGSGIAGGAAFNSHSLNPALIAKSDHLIQGSLGGFLYRNDEDRAYPYYDSFDDFQDFFNLILRGGR